MLHHISTVYWGDNEGGSDILTYWKKHPTNFSFDAFSDIFTLERKCIWVSDYESIAFKSWKYVMQLTFLWPLVNR